MRIAVFVGMLLGIMFGAVALIPISHAQQNACQSNPCPVDSSDPSIIVSAPAPNARVMASPIRVSGQARVFEATVSLTLYDVSGNEIGSTTTNAAEGGVLSPFSGDVSFSTDSNTAACLWVFEVSARDGSPTNVVKIPLILNAAGLPSTGSGAGRTGDQAAFWIIGALAIVGVVGSAGALSTARRR